MEEEFFLSIRESLPFTEDQGLFYIITRDRDKAGSYERYIYKFQSAASIFKILSETAHQEEESSYGYGYENGGSECAVPKGYGYMDQGNAGSFHPLNNEPCRSEDIERLKEEVRKRLELISEISDEIVERHIEGAIEELEPYNSYSQREAAFLKKEVFNSIRRLDVLQDFIEDESVTEIMVNGLHSIFVERSGRLIDTGKAFSSKERLYDIIQQIVAGANRTDNTSSPIVDARLPSGERVNVVLDPVAVNGPILTIRRFPSVPISDRQLLETGSVSEEVLDFLKKAVAAKYNIIISGGTGCGKTTFLNILSGYIPKTERIITIEDSAELQIRGISNLVSLETRNANTEGVKPITIRDLIKASLRMRPDRVVVGEVRGEEAIDMLQAMNVGLDGSLSTIHANSAKDGLSRLEAMMLMSTKVPIEAVRRQMASGIDIIVQLGRLRDKSRHLIEIIEVIDFVEEEIRTSRLFCFREEGEKNGRITGRIIKENELFNTEKLKRAGISL